MRKLLKEPLVQFLLIALLLLGGERLINADDYANEQYRILVDDQVLLQFMQLQAKMFKPSQAKAVLEAMSPEDRQRLVGDYSRNEVLFREAMALNLDKNDQIIRRRLIQKMDYLAQGFYDQAKPISEDDLRGYYTEHQEDYQKAASATFTHVFISTDTRGTIEAKTIAETLLKTLMADQIPFENAPRYGERFLYNRNYVNRDDNEISSHFGNDFRDSVFALEVTGDWQGPVQSSYGWHLVLLKKNTPAYIPEFDEIRSAVFADVERYQQQQTKREAINKLMAKYKISDQGQQ